jgi:hypothetical protein
MVTGFVIFEAVYGYTDWILKYYLDEIRIQKFKLS